MKLVTRHSSLVTRHSSLVTRHSVSRKAFAMLAVLMLLTFTLASPRAQSNTEYNFRQQSVTDGVAYNGNGDPVPVLSMDCLAANGYGQWTLSTTGGVGNYSSHLPPSDGSTLYPPGWYLLANGLYAPSEGFISLDPTHPQCIPPGVVQNGTLTDAEPTQPKNATNCDGDVCYVWPGPGETFLVRLFTKADINISFSFCSNPTTSRNILPTGILHTFTIPTSGHTIVSETDFRDIFDVKMDAAFIYITWCSNETGTNTIWVMTIPIGMSAATNTISPGAGCRPTIACCERNNRGGGSTPSFVVGYLTGVGGSPVAQSWNGTWTTYTLAASCFDPRMSGTLPYGNTLHVRAVASDVLNQTSVTFGLYLIATVTAGLNTRQSLLLYPNLQPTVSMTASYCDGGLVAVNSSLLAGATVPPEVKDEPITAFCDPYNNQLMFDGFHCVYRLHAQLPAEPGPGVVQRYPLLIMKGIDNGKLSTIDTRLLLSQNAAETALTDDPALPETGGAWLIPYCAAVNQMGIHVHWRTAAGVHFYSRDTSRTFDEPIDETTLVTDICTVSDGSPTGTNHGGTVGATILDNITMGIWTDPNYGYSASNPFLSSPNFGLYQPRTLNGISAAANIDIHVGQLDFRGENVMLYVGNGRVACGSTPANLTDMPYFFFNFYGNNQGNTQGVVVNGTWDYYGLIAVHDPTTELPTLVGSPFTNGTLAAGPGDGVGPFAVPCESGGGSITIGTTSPIACGDERPPTMPGLLNVHGGANFFCGEWTYFTAIPDLNGVSGNIDVMFDGNVFPNTVVTSTTTGLLTLDGKTILQATAPQTFPTWSAGGCMRGNIPFPDRSNPTVPAYDPVKGVILYVGEVWDPDDHPTSEGTTQFKANNFTFFNSDNWGTSELQIGNFDPNGTNADDADGGDITFNGGLGDAIEIHLIDPNPDIVPEFEERNYTIENMAFNDLRSYTIRVEDDQEDYEEGGGYLDPYANVTITGNTFEAFAGDVGMPYGYMGDQFEDVPVYGIYLQNLDGPVIGAYSSVPFGTINVTSNNFTCTQTSSAIYEVNDGDAVSAAIDLHNTTAFVVDNTITDNGWPIGINIEGTDLPDGSTPPTTLSFMCKNTITGLQAPPPDLSYDLVPQTEVAIQSQYSSGYTKLNTITNNDIAYYSNGPDHPKVVLNTITGNGTYGIYINGDFGQVDLSGWHGTTTGSDDFPGYNTISGPSQVITGSSASPGLLVINDGGETNSWFNLANTIESFHWMNYGHNNIEVSSSPTAPSMPLIQSVSSTLSVGSIDRNFFENSFYAETLNPALSMTNWIGSANPTEVDAFQISFSPGTPDPSFNNITDFWHDGASCGSGTGFVTKHTKAPKPLAQDSLPTGCQLLFNECNAYDNNQLWQMTYDTGMKLVEQCQDPNGFYFMTDAVNGLGNLGQLRADYFAWLKSVLYLNTTNPSYFCACVYAIPGELPVPNHIYPDTGYNWGLAVLNWLIQNTTCDTPSLQKLYNRTRQTQIETWQNASGEYKLDTTLPTMQQLGLDTLLNRHFLYSVSQPPQGIISNATANPNPVTSGTVISFGISQEAYVKIEVFDILGHEVASAGFESLFEPGNKSVPISLAGLPSGTYFARILTAYGEVQSVKLVKE